MSLQSGDQPAMPDAPAASGGYEGVGHSLKVVRERRGLELADVSARLRIRRHYLEAIETGRFGELPGAVYINGFLRQYAEFLGLEADQVLKTYQDEADAPPQRPVLNFPMPRPEDRTPRLWMVAGALIIAVAIYALWYRHQETIRLGHDLIEAVPAHLADMVPSPTPIAQTPAAQTAVSQAAGSAAPAVAAPVPAGAPVAATGASASPPPNPPAQPAAPAGTADAAPATTVAALPQTAPGAGQPPAPTQPPAAAAPEPSPAQADTTTGSETADAAAPPAAEAAPTVFGATDAANARVRLEATALAWIQVRGPNNEQVFTRLLHAGESYVVPPDRSGLTLLTGNAGGLHIVVDGRTLPPLGADGEVKRGILLDADRLKSAEGSQG